MRKLIFVFVQRDETSFPSGRFNTACDSEFNSEMSLGQLFLTMKVRKFNFFGKVFERETKEGQKLPVGSIRQQFVSKKLENMFFCQ